MARRNKPEVRPNKPADFSVHHEGSLTLLNPLSKNAKAWMKKEMADQPDYLFFGEAIAIEHRYVAEILRILVDEGFTVI